jgi:S-adenosylmethionine:tRNA ribosyltransferase-isomerase
MYLKDFDFILPDNLIATSPVEPRDSSRMLVLKDGNNLDKKFSDISDYLNEGDLIIFNNSKVIKAKLEAKLGDRVFSLNLHKMINNNTWVAFVKNAKKLNIGDELQISDSDKFIIIQKDFGEITIKFNSDNILELLEKYGQIPIPPYMKRNSDNSDLTNYQTIYAKIDGSVAAPTAGLHFTDKILDSLKNKNIQIDFVTLHVGAGTFLPVKTDFITDHKMHSEICYLSEETAEKIKQTKLRGNKVIAVGTTTLRTLESAYLKNNGIAKFAGDTDIFIYPGFKFNIVDKLLTNFHLPKSTLLMLISAFSGYDNIKQLYQHAIKSEYRFYSYGDCCLLEKEKND